MDFHPTPEALASTTHTDPTHTDTTHTDPTHTDTTHTDPTHTDPTHTDPTHTDSTHTDTTHTDPTHTDTTHTETTIICMSPQSKAQVHFFNNARNATDTERPGVHVSMAADRPENTDTKPPNDGDCAENNTGYANPKLHIDLLCLPSDDDTKSPPCSVHSAWAPEQSDKLNLPDVAAVKLETPSSPRLPDPLTGVHQPTRRAGAAPLPPTSKMTTAQHHGARPIRIVCNVGTDRGDAGSAPVPAPSPGSLSSTQDSGFKSSSKTSQSPNNNNMDGYSPNYITIGKAAPEINQAEQPDQNSPEDPEATKSKMFQFESSLLYLSLALLILPCMPCFAIPALLFNKQSRSALLQQDLEAGARYSRFSFYLIWAGLVTFGVLTCTVIVHVGISLALDNTVIPTQPPGQLFCDKQMALYFEGC